MDLNFGFQQNEEEKLEKIFRRQLKKKNRKHIVSEMMEVKGAKKEAVSEKKNYYKYKAGIDVKKAKKVRKRKKDKESIFKRAYTKVKKKIYSYQSIYLYGLYTLLDGWDHILVRKDFYQKLAALVLAFFDRGLLQVAAISCGAVLAAELLLPYII